MTEIIPVLFRNARDNGETYLTAVFPTLEANRGRMVCYAHIGQHGECSIGWYATTTPAAPSDYADLLRELFGIYERDGDTLRVMKRRPAWSNRT